MQPQYDGVILIGHGGPAHRLEVPTYLENMFHGRRISKDTFQTIQQKYDDLGGSSPYFKMASRQVQILMSLLRAEGIDFHVYLGMRHWHPFIGETLLNMANDNVRKAIGIIMQPFCVSPSWQQYLGAIKTGQERLGMSAPEVDILQPEHLDPLFIDVVSEQISDQMVGIAPGLHRQIRWIFTALGVHETIDRHCGYSDQLLETASKIAGNFRHDRWSLAFQTRVGEVRDHWRQPDVAAAVESAAREGTSQVLVIPLGFILDDIEIRYDLDIELRELAARRGLVYHRAKTVGDHPKFMVMLLNTVLGKIREKRTEQTANLI